MTTPLVAVEPRTHAIAAQPQERGRLRDTLDRTIENAHGTHRTIVAHDSPFSHDQWDVVSRLLARVVHLQAAFELPRAVRPIRTVPGEEFEPSRPDKEPAG